MSLTKKGAAFFGTAVAAMAFTAIAAFGACTNLATLNLSNGSGGAGDAIAVTGSSFRVATGDSRPPSACPGPAWPLRDRRRQKDAEGADAYGTPARASFQLLGPNGESVVQPAGNQAAPVTADASSSGIIALTVGLGVLGLALFGAGFTAFVRQARSREVPVASKVRND